MNVTDRIDVSNLVFLLVCLFISKLKTCIKTWNWFQNVVNEFGARNCFKTICSTMNMNVFSLMISQFVMISRNILHSVSATWWWYFIDILPDRFDKYHLIQWFNVWWWDISSLTLGCARARWLIIWSKRGWRHGIYSLHSENVMIQVTYFVYTLFHFYLNWLLQIVSKWAFGPWSGFIRCECVIRQRVITLIPNSYSQSIICIAIFELSLDTYRMEIME